MAFKTNIANETILEQTADITKLVDQLGVVSKAIDKLQVEEEKLKTTLKTQAKEAWFTYNFETYQGPQHTFDQSGRNFIAQINFENSYFLNKERFTQLQPLIVEDAWLIEAFQEQPVVNINVHELEPEERTEFYKAIKEVCDDFGVQGFVDEKYVVDPEFHNQRHELLPAVNKAIDAILPVKIAVTI
jgi:hypothetical protein